MPVSVQIRLLGGFTISGVEDCDLTPPGRKLCALIACLALSPGKAWPRERLTALLWGNRDEEQARASLRQALSMLHHSFRRAGADPVHADRNCVTLKSTEIEVDAVEFEQLVHEARAWEQAAAIYRGELLDGIEPPTSEFEEWLRLERERFGDLAVRVLEHLVLEAGASAADEAIRIGRHMLARDHLREPIYRALMRVHARQGQRAKALKLYGACRDALRQHLGVTPDFRTEELYRDILTDRLSHSEVGHDEASALGRASIAVLPLSNLSSDPNLARLCDGITEDIITGLGRFRQLFVIDRHSSSAASQEVSDMAAIGQRLGVSYLVQASLKRLGEEARITVRLIDARTRAQLWGEAYNCAWSEILIVPDKITGAIVSTLYGRVEDTLLERTRRKPFLVAYDCVLRGIRHLRGYAPDDNWHARHCFQQAIDLDPEYALARAYHALADLIVQDYGDAPDADLAQTLAMASTAVDLDVSDSRAQWILGYIHRFRGEFEDAERHYRQAIKLNPNDANAVAVFGSLLTALGRPEEGIGHIREAMRLNPYHPDWLWVQLGIALYVAQRYADAAEAFGRTARTGFWNLCFLAASLAQMGRLDVAAATVVEARQLRPRFVLGPIRFAEWGAGDARRIKDGMRKAGLPDR